MNFAGATDRARIQILADFGGIYLDTDILPPLYDEISLDYKQIKYLEKFKINVDDFKRELRIANYEQVFNENKNLLKTLKGRVKSDKFINIIKSYIENISSESKGIKLTEEDISVKTSLTEIPNLILKCAESSKDKNIEELFRKIRSPKLVKGEIVMLGNENSLANAGFDIHETYKESDEIFKIMKIINLKDIEISKYQQNTSGKAIDLIRAKEDLNNSDINTDNINLKYRYDGLVKNARTTIEISGPQVYINYYNEEYLDFSQKYRELPLYKEFNAAFTANTEEDYKSSWVYKKEDNLGLLKIPEC